MTLLLERARWSNGTSARRVRRFHQHHLVNDNVDIPYGGFVALLPGVDDFGGKNVGGIIGIPCPSTTFGTLIGRRLAGFAFDFSGRYTQPIFASAISSVEAACIIAGTARVRIPLYQKELP